VVIFITKPSDTKDCAMEDATSDATMVSYAKHLYVAAAVVNRHLPATERWFDCPLFLRRRLPEAPFGKGPEEFIVSLRRPRYSRHCCRVSIGDDGWAFWEAILYLDITNTEIDNYKLSYRCSF
jgi:hypothetical protein